MANIFETRRISGEKIENTGRLRRRILKARARRLRQKAQAHVSSVRQALKAKSEAEKIKWRAGSGPEKISAPGLGPGSPSLHDEC